MNLFDYLNSEELPLPLVLAIGLTLGTVSVRAPVSAEAWGNIDYSRKKDGLFIKLLNTANNSEEADMILERMGY